MTDFIGQRVLIVNTFGIGDVLFTTPLIANIKKYNFDIRLGYVANARTADVLNHHPLIDDVYVYDRDEFHEVYCRSKTAFLKKAKAFLDNIRSHHYNIVIDLSMNMPTGLLMKMAGIQKRIGFDYKGRGKFLTHRIPFKGYEGKHVVQFYLDLLNDLEIPVRETAMNFPIDLESEQWVKDVVHRYHLGEEMLVIVPGGGASWGRDAARKQWPVQKFADLADRLVEMHGARIVLCGGPSDKALTQEILNMMKNIALDFTGELALRQSAALFSKSRLVIANDGGPLHMAVASGAKTVSIFGPVDERVYGPYPRDGHRVVTSNIACRPCYRRFRVAKCDHISCLRDLSVDVVLGAVKEML